MRDRKPRIEPDEAPDGLVDESSAESRRRLERDRRMRDYLMRLFRHMAWADERALAALRKAGGASDLAHRELAHVLGAEHVWLARLEGRPAAVAVWPELSVDECEALARDTRAGFQAYIERTDDATLERTVHYRNSAGAEFDTKASDILLHVALHGTYHRGKVAAAIRAAGAEPAPTDYIAFVRGVPAATRADAVRAGA